MVVVSMTFISCIPVRAPLGVRNISFAIREFITAKASASCRSCLGFATVRANVYVKSYQRVSNELDAAQIQLLTGKIAFRYETLEKAFKELTYEMDLLAKLDTQVHGEYKKLLNGFLIKAMEERMGGRKG